MMKKLKFLLDGLPLATELAFSIILLGALGYFLGKMINDFMGMMGMLLGTLLGLGGGIYHIYQKIK